MYKRYKTDFRLGNYLLSIENRENREICIDILLSIKYILFYSNIDMLLNWGIFYCTLSHRRISSRCLLKQLY